MNSAYSNQSRYQISALTDNVDQTLTKLAQKGYFPHEKTEHHHLILHIRISPGNQFYFNMTILIFWIKFDQKDISSWKQQKSVSQLNSGYSN